MAHAQKPDSVFRRNGRVHLNRRGRQFSRLLAAEVCASALVMLDTPCSEVVWEYWLPTPFASLPFTSPLVRHRVPSGFKRTLQNYSRLTKNKGGSGRHRFTIFSEFRLARGSLTMPTATRARGPQPAQSCSSNSICYYAEEFNGEWIIVHRMTTNDSFPAATRISQNAKNSVTWHHRRRIWRSRDIQIISLYSNC